MSELTYEQKRELLNPAGKRYASVAEMVRERGDEEFAKELEAESSHLWIAVPAGMPLEESAICSKCGAYGNSEQLLPCS